MSKARVRQIRPRLEDLESRLVLYSASGYAWPSPQLITISFMPDGTNIGGHATDMQSRLNSMFGSASTWQNIILKAAQTWATYANINFEVVSDSGAAQGSGSYQQGDPNFGDIRIGGYNFNSSNVLASAYMPPPANNYSIAGDISFNTGQAFHNGMTYDLFTVAAHEIGHSLGLYHSATAPAEEYATYNSSKSVFNSDDIAGIQAIYGRQTARPL
jgi:predicted Zn-dependent protease